MSIDHYLTYQHNVQKYFRRHRDKYSGIIVPMSIAVSFPGGTYGFVRALCARDTEKRYAIDPRTPLFQKAWNRAHVRPPHEKMAQVLGTPFSDKGLTDQVEASDFDSDDNLEAVVQRCVDFQLRFRTRDEDAKKLAKYKRLLGIDSMAELGEPQFLIPPYFQFDREQDAWFRINARASAMASSHNAGVPLRPVVHFRDWGSFDNWDGLLAGLKRTGIESAWIYPNNFKEHEAAPEELARYRSAIEQSVNNEVEPFALFGGYFAVMLSPFGLRGFANGVGYGEWRDSGYHRGGTASTRVYVPRLHRYLDAPEAQNLVEKDPDYFAGDSDLIASCFDEGRALDSLDQEQWLDHFMECRRAEIEFVQREGIGAARDEIGETLGHLDNLGSLEQERYGVSLRRWLEATQ